MPPEQSSAASSSSGSITNASLQDFWRLPSELQQRILLLACRAPAYSDKDLNKRSSLALDFATTRSLALVSRQLYPQIVTLLYSHVKITTISGLRSFQQALSSRPALGRSVKSLHLGPADSLPPKWWPLLIDADILGHALDYPRFYITTSLHERDDDERPRWCEPQRDWNVEGGYGNMKCYDRAVHRALDRAKKGLDAAPCQPHCDRTNGRIGRDSWALKIWQLQACLDLYLGEMRKIENARGYAVPSWRNKPRKSPSDPPQCDGKGCGHYPDLVVTPTPTSAVPRSASSCEGSQAWTFQLTMTQINAHLARPGSLTDRLDNPIVLARSGILMFDVHGHRPAGDDWEIRDRPYSLEQEEGYMRDYEGTSDFADLFAVGEHLEIELGEDVYPDSVFTTALEPATSSTPTIGSLLALARSVLSYTPALENLSLTGFLERAICGNRPPPGLKALRAVSLGPPTPYWYLRLHLDHPALCHIEKLRVCGSVLLGPELNTFSGPNGRLLCLKEFQYSVATREGCDQREGVPIASRQAIAPCLSVVHLWDNVNWRGDRTQAGQHEEQEGEGARKRQRRQDGDNEMGEDGYWLSRRSSGREEPIFIDARLHPDEAKTVLSTAPSAEVRAAWLKGEAIPGQGPQHRLRVAKTRVPIVEKDGSDWTPPTVPQELYDEGMEWWEERAREGRGGAR